MVCLLMKVPLQSHHSLLLRFMRKFTKLEVGLNSSIVADDLVRSGFSPLLFFLVGFSLDLLI